MQSINPGPEMGGDVGPHSAASGNSPARATYDPSDRWAVAAVGVQRDMCLCILFKKVDLSQDPKID